jgi:hypothetical protein
MKKVFYWIFLFSILSCSKKDPCEGVEKIQITGYKNLDESQKQLMPYQGNETLLFISNKGDTALLKGTGNRQEYRRLKLSGSGFNCGEEHYDSYQFLAAEYNGDNPKFNQLKIELFKGYANETSFNFYFNENRGYYVDLWDGYNVEFMNNQNILPYKVYFRGDSVIAKRLFWGNFLKNYDYPWLIYIKEIGIIGFQIDSLNTFMLK